MNKFFLLFLSLSILAGCTSGNGPKVSKDIDPPVIGSSVHKLEQYIDYQCPACINFSKTLGPILEKYAADGNLEITYRQFPLTNIHPNAYRDALAAMCAHEDEKYMEYKTAIYGLEEARNSARVSDEDRIKLAKDIGLDEAKFGTCLREEHYKAHVDQDMSDGNKANVGGTPSLILDGKFLDLGIFRNEQMFRDFMDKYLGVEKDTQTTGTGSTQSGATQTGNIIQ